MHPIIVSSIFLSQVAIELGCFALFPILSTFHATKTQKNMNTKENLTSAVHPQSMAMDSDKGEPKYEELAKKVTPESSGGFVQKVERRLISDFGLLT